MGHDTTQKYAVLLPLPLPWEVQVPRPSGSQQVPASCPQGKLVSKGETSPPN